METKDDIETMRILFGAEIGALCIQQRWNDAKEMEGIRDRLMQALETQDEDCISRQAVLSMQYRIDDSATLSTRDVVNVDDILDLPSVNPQPKTGHWTTLEEWKNDFKGFINELSMPKDDYKGIMEYIDEVSNEARWIPVNENLPRKSGYYWCTFGGANLTGSDYYITETAAVLFSDDPEKYAGWRSQNVVAWMPLPKPFKPQKSEG